MQKYFGKYNGPVIGLLDPTKAPMGGLRSEVAWPIHGTGGWNERRFFQPGGPAFWDRPMFAEHPDPILPSVG